MIGSLLLVWGTCAAKSGRFPCVGVKREPRQHTSGSPGPTAFVEIQVTGKPEITPRLVSSFGGELQLPWRCAPWAAQNSALDPAVLGPGTGHGNGFVHLDRAMGHCDRSTVGKQKAPANMRETRQVC